MSTMTAPAPTTMIGTTFVNGTTLHARTFDWSAVLTVTSLDVRSYGVTRYVVVDRYGRHGYAY